jgi:hypothetical protein
VRRFTLISSDAKIKEKRARSFGLVLSFAAHVGVLFGDGCLFENGVALSRHVYLRLMEWSSGLNASLSEMLQDHPGKSF